MAFNNNGGVLSRWTAVGFLERGERSRDFLLLVEVLFFEVGVGMRFAQVGEASIE